MDQKIVLGTRGSELALAQARLVERALQQQWPELNVETKIIATRGDQTKPIDSRGGWKGLFTAEIEKALLAGDIDLAVHSAKDLPSETSSALEIAAVLVRGPFEDVLLSKHAGKFASLPTKAIVATSSIRRKYQLHWKRPDLIVVDLRGNVPTRVKKLTDGDWDAVVLARAGIERLGLTSPTLFSETLPLEIFLPAGGQGIIAIQIRENDEEARTIVVAVNDSDTMACLRAERAFLHLLNVDCNAPVGVLARIDNGLLKMRAQFFGEGSSAPREGEVEGQSDRGELLAAQLLDQLRT